MGVEKCLFLLYCECMGNNRTTLESKAFITKNRNGSSVVIIEPHWNLKYTYEQLISICGLVIIEPHWNLKEESVRETIAAEK